MALWVRQSSPNSAGLRQSSHEGARILLVRPGTCLISREAWQEFFGNFWACKRQGPNISGRFRTIFANLGTKKQIYWADFLLQRCHPNNVGWSTLTGIRGHLKPITLKPVIRIFRIFRVFVSTFSAFSAFSAFLLCEISSDPGFSGVRGSFRIFPVSGSNR